ncbi:MAG: DUF2007 domain-containing protein [Cellulophaga sp.]|uniref:putative signal transducing protein n=1 Tax=unclassified Cellulophaga TaxID=2634405 RepID=UPI0026E3EB23|nr:MULTISPECIES: DUF2007 domain-containing protein [unclassified Cellulophaga]MDO6492066.1 DUF2007 domain-containing protein [Cellulophaga sp. 2_MG-2023]MDO6495773.1 DUF2007 domain-containing protein [Cellulophaga sp. 3_MG-2023]
MLKSNYQKIYSGNQFDVKAIVEKLHSINIEGVVKDESESGRLAGFASAIPGEQDLYVHNDEAEKALELIKSHFKK